jgi:hypothetical protein
VLAISEHNYRAKELAPYNKRRRSIIESHVYYDTDNIDPLPDAMLRAKVIERYKVQG